MSRKSKNPFRIFVVAVVALVLVFVVVYIIFSKVEERLIEEKKEICLDYASQFSHMLTENTSIVLLHRLLNQSSLSVDSSDLIDHYFSGILSAFLIEKAGLEGGIYISSLDDFIAYAFPTSPPPIPVYGPPPRSHNIIREQALLSLKKNEALVNVHSFDPAVFPLATVPFSYAGKTLGTVWIRVHIERELPLARLMKVANFLTIISIVGFIVMALYSFFLRNGIKDIKKELDNTTMNPSYRLKKRGGWFAFIPASINEMLNMLEKENHDREKLEKQLQQEEKLASLGKMVAGVAHEVKTPLAVIKMRVQMWEKEIRNDETFQEKISPESISLVLDEINRLSSLVKRLVVFSRPINKNLTQTNLEQTIEEVIGMIDMERSGSKVQLITSYFIPCPQIYVDGNAIKQVLINVLQNALESVGENGLVKIVTNYVKKENLIEILIEDNGPGIPDEIIDKVFDPFFTSKESGTGLGLAISHEIVAAHKGSISFTNCKPRGLKCLIQLPINNK